MGCECHFNLTEVCLPIEIRHRSWFGVENYGVKLLSKIALNGQSDQYNKKARGVDSHDLRQIDSLRN